MPCVYNYKIQTLIKWLKLPEHFYALISQSGADSQGLDSSHEVRAGSRQHEAARAARRRRRDLGHQNSE